MPKLRPFRRRPKTLFSYRNTLIAKNLWNVVAVAWRGKEARSSLSTREMIGERWKEWDLELEFAVVVCPYLPFFFPLHPNQLRIVLRNSTKTERDLFT